MPYSVPLSKQHASEGWKVKIYEKERLEPPHVTVTKQMRVWRIGLRDKDFLIPPGGAWKELPDDVSAVIEEYWDELVAQWDAMYPSNPVGAKDD